LLNINAFADDAVLINELALDNFSRRADIVVVNGNIEMFEIKSEVDNLSRLPGQIETFFRFCDKLHVVSAPCHIGEILSNTPEYIAVWELDYQKGVKVIRRGKKVPLNNKGDLLSMISVRELRQLLASKEIKNDARLRRHLDSVAVTKLSVKEIRHGVLQALKDRYAKTTERFFGLATMQGVSPDHIDILKRPNARYQSKDSHRVEEDNSSEDDVYLLQLASETKGALFGVPPSEIRKLFRPT
jgi:hypothetical protein